MHFGNARILVLPCKKNTNTKTSLSMKTNLLFALAIFSFCLSQAQTTISGNITSNTTWNNNQVYLLSGFVRVLDGVTLTIQEGTLIKGDYDTQGTLIIERGGKIIANGTAQQPIVFTSARPAGIDPETGAPFREYGDWGGVIICGRARVNQPANSANGTAQGEAMVEGGVGSVYGGGANPNDDDNSGSMSYVRIEYGGIPFQPNSEINGLTLCGVGRGTSIHHIQVSYIGDDAIECFGGTVNLKYIVCYRNWDDDFDTDFGYQGNIQFGLSVRDPQIADQSGSNAFESDNDAQGNAYDPYTQPHYSNMTVIGPYTFNSTINSNYKRGMHFRRNSQASIFNSIVTGYPVGLLIDGSTTQSNASNGFLRVQHNVLANMTDTLAALTTANPNNVNGTFDISSFWSTAGWGNETVNSVADLAFNNVSLSAPDFTLSGGSSFNTGADFTNDYLLDGFFEPVTFRGAFGSENWTLGWTNWQPSSMPYLAGITSVSEITSTSNIRIFPNPVNDRINVVLADGPVRNVQINVLELSGKVVSTEQYVNHDSPSITLNTSKLSNGFYFLQVIDSRGTATQRFAVER